MRIDKFLADMGFGTRNEVKKMLRNGYVEMDGIPIKKADTKVDIDTIVYVDGQPVQYIENEYYLLYKPSGYICAREDGRYPTVMELIQSYKNDLSHVGRLDLDTEGVLLITNDGDLNHKLVSPKNHVEKKYYGEVDKALPDDAKELFSQPMEFEDFISKPAQYEQIDETSAYLTITEGKFHQVKRMFEKIGCTVTYLRRDAFDFLTLDGLNPGEYRALNEEELKRLKER